MLTPNNDGFNDRWQIYGIKEFPNSRTLIYDRYGKLIKELTSNSTGWDGSYHGRQMLQVTTGLL
ncbi:T9SS type B sorting domain-containing protein [Zunongwangia profunda]|uniref:T9SS type B sorting domain-containing protein n=1 Tax=Zunongwangia profunda TaxID=398743 RepID=UPI00374D4A44|nr:T9SS type B sorting domain-containing protein [Zunongwangia profunda]